MYISTPPGPEVESFQIKIYYPVGDWTPDLLNQRQTCYHLSQRRELDEEYVDESNSQETDNCEELQHNSTFTILLH